MADPYLNLLKARRNKALLLLKQNPERMGTEVQCGEFIKVNKKICFLESLSFIVSSAPRTMDEKKINAHFLIFNNFLKNELNTPKMKLNTEIKNVYSYVDYLKELYLNIEKKIKE